MHSCETLAVPPTSGPNLLLQLGRLIIRARSSSPASRVTSSPPTTHDRLLHAKLLAAKPSTSQQVVTQPKCEDKEPKPAVEQQLGDHVRVLWKEQIPVCIEILLAPDCQECYAALSADEDYDKIQSQKRGLLLERWTMRVLVNKSHDTPAFTTSQWLMNAVRSQLHFSQLAAWLATLKETKTEDNPTERRRKLSREKCNFKKLEANCDETELPTEQQRNLNIVYSIKIPGESYDMTEFSRNPTTHNFPITDIGDNASLKITLESLPRVDEIPKVKCSCQKRRPSKDIPPSIHDELVGKLNDLTIGSRNESVNYHRLYSEEVVDDRMMTPCSENGKHKCNCDEESDGKEKTKENERRLKEIAKCKRRMRKETKIKLNESTSSEGDRKETHTSIPILQAARFDRFRAIGCYRNQTYLTLPASRLETKSPFIDTDDSLPIMKKTNTVSTQTDEMQCQCGMLINLRCDNCRMIRSEASYDLTSINGARRKCEDYPNKFKKHKCDITCDNSLVKRPKLRRLFPIVDRMERVVSDRQKKDIEELHLKTDDTVFSSPKDTKRQKTYSISDDDYVLYENCDYGTFDKCDLDSPDEAQGFRFPEKEEQVPSSSEVDRFRWRFDSAASMVFHTKTGLPLTSSPAPLRRSNNCFDFDDSINGISGIKSALFYPITPVSLAPPTSPVSPASSEAPAIPARCSTPPLTLKKEETTPKLRIGPSSGLLGSFEESALKGRLEPVATVQGFTAELGASGAFCPAHKRLPVTVFFYAPGGTNAPYMGHINLGRGGYLVSPSGTIQVSLFNPHGTLVKMFVVLYDLRSMPPRTRTFLRQRTLYMPAGAGPKAPDAVHARKWLRYLIHLRFMTSKSGKLYLHTDIRIIVSRKADLDTATAHSALFRPKLISKINEKGSDSKPPNQNDSTQMPTIGSTTVTETVDVSPNIPDRAPNRVFGGCGDFDSKFKPIRELGYENRNDVSYELRSFTYAPENPKYSPR